MVDDDQKVVHLRGAQQKLRVRANETLIESFEYKGIGITVVQNNLTRRFKARFVVFIPTRYTTASMTAREAKRRAIKLIDTLNA